MSRKTCYWPAPIVLLGVFFVFAVWPARAQQEARLYLQPVESEDGLLFEVMAENVTNLYGAEFRLSYDPAVLAVQDLNTGQEGPQIEPGTLLPVNSGFVVANKVDEQAGIITFAMTLLNPAPAVTGSGPLAQVAFKRLGNSPATVEIAHAKLVAVDLQTIPSQTSGFTLAPAAGESGGNLSAPGEAAFSTTFPWWIVAAAILILGSLALGSLIMWGRPPQGQTSGAAVSPGPVRRQYAHEISGSGSRPSAFKQQSFSAEKPPRPE